MFHVVPPEFLMTPPDPHPYRLYSRPVSSEDILRRLGLVNHDQTTESHCPCLRRHSTSDANKPEKSPEKSRTSTISAQKQATAATKPTTLDILKGFGLPVAYDETPTEEATLDFRGFSPEQISVKVKDGCVLVRGEQKNDFTNVQITKSVPLPEGADRNSIRCHYVDGHVVLQFSGSSKQSILEEPKREPVTVEGKKGEETSVEESKGDFERDRLAAFAKLLSALYGVDILKCDDMASKEDMKIGKQKETGENLKDEEKKENTTAQTEKEKIKAEVNANEDPEETITKSETAEHADFKDSEITTQGCVSETINESQRNEGEGVRKEEHNEDSCTTPELTKESETKVKAEDDLDEELSKNEAGEIDEETSDNLNQSTEVNPEEDSTSDTKECPESLPKDDQECGPSENELESTANSEEGDFVRIEEYESEAGVEDDDDSLSLQIDNDSVKETELSTSDDLEVAEIFEPKMFSVQLDMSNFSPDDIHVTCKDGDVTVEAERDIIDDNCRQTEKLCRRIKLPEDADEFEMKSFMNLDGVLTIQAPYKPVGQTFLKNEDSLRLMD